MKLQNSLLLSVVLGLAPLEPANNKMLVGAWLDTRVETPVQFNERVGFSASFFQLAENFPLNFNDPPPFKLLDDTNTNTMLLLTVYPRPLGFAAIGPNDNAELVKQVAGLTKRGRRVFLRLAPEMNGSWYACNNPGSCLARSPFSL
jgi:hypothetical protein